MTFITPNLYTFLQGFQVFRFLLFWVIIYYLLMIFIPPEEYRVVNFRDGKYFNKKRISRFFLSLSLRLDPLLQSWNRHPADHRLPFLKLGCYFNMTYGPISYRKNSHRVSHEIPVLSVQVLSL